MTMTKKTMMTMTILKKLMPRAQMMIRTMRMMTTMMMMMMSQSQMVKMN